MKKRLSILMLFILLFSSFSIKASAFTEEDSYNKYCNPRNNVYPSDNICIYMSTVSSYSGNYLLYDKSNGDILYYVFNNDEKIIIPYGEKIEKSNYGVFNNYESQIEFNSSCPSVIYLHNDVRSNYTYNNYFSTQNEMVKDKILLRDTLEKYECVKNNGGTTNNNEENCEIFSDKLIDIVNEIMSYIRIGVPLLLIGLIILDFVKATFANDDKAISKSKNNAIKRIIIAVVIFFVPTILNLIFNVANDVWKDTHYEICGLDNNN